MNLVRHCDIELTGAHPLWAPSHDALLVGSGFRCWLSGFRTGDIRCWEHVWRAFESHLGRMDARRAVVDLSMWVQRIDEERQRELTLSALDDKRLARDERLAVSLVAAAQTPHCPALQACASALLGSEKLDNVLGASRQFARTLTGAGVVLPADLAKRSLELVGDVR